MIKGLTPGEGSAAKAKIDQDVSVTQTVIILCHVMTDIIEAITVQEPESTEWEPGDYFKFADERLIRQVQRVAGNNLIDMHDADKFNSCYCRKVQVKL